MRTASCSVIAKSLPITGPILTTIINVSTSSGIFPDTWRIHHRSLIFALLSFLSKVLEKIVNTQITDYLSHQQILDLLPTGFRQYNSTQTVLLKLTEDIRGGIHSDTKLLTILLLFDFSTAFVTISPRKFLRKLSKIGFSRTFLLWIKSYIVGRTQRVVLGQRASQIGLSPIWEYHRARSWDLSYSAYISMIFQSSSTLLNYKIVLKPSTHSLRSDLQTYVHTTIDELTAGIERLSDTARAVAAWDQSSGLRLNFRKTKAIIFGSKYNINLVHEFQLPGIEVDDGGCTFRGHGYKPQYYYGQTTTNNSKLTWKEHVEHVTKTVNRVLYSLKLFKSSTTEALRKQLAGALAMPHIDYYSLVFLDINDGPGNFKSHKIHV